MSNEIFPELPGLAWNTTKKPKFSTTIHETRSGKETTLANWSYPKWIFGLSFEVLDDSELIQDLKTLGGFFLARHGAADDFLYRDSSDYKVEGQVIGIGDGARTAFQLIRSFGVFDEPIKAIEGVIGAPLTVPGVAPDDAPVIYLDGSIATDYTISTTGLVTFTTAPADGVEVSVDFSFYFRCRFDKDEAEFAQFMADLWECKKLDLVSKKV